MARGEELSGIGARYAIGIGARRGVDAQELVRLVRNVCETYARAPSPAGGRRRPGHGASVRTPVASAGLMAGSDEGSPSLRDIDGMSGPDPLPTSLREATFSREWEKEPRVEISLFTIDSKRGEAGFLEAARLLNMRLVFLTLEALLARRDELLTRSPRVEALTGVGSVAEAAALVGAGRGSLLLGPRVANARATCAIARNALEMAP